MLYLFLQLPILATVWKYNTFLADGAYPGVATIRPEQVMEIRKTVDEYLNSGRVNDLLSYLAAVERKYNTLLIDDRLPSLYNYLGVALSHAQRPEEAQVAFMEGLKYFPNDTRSMLNLGEIRTQTFKVYYGTYSYISPHTVCIRVTDSPSSE
jgi:tetratricopeptide (TPR) repeat protein